MGSRKRAESCDSLSARCVGPMSPSPGMAVLLVTMATPPARRLRQYEHPAGDVFFARATAAAGCGCPGYTVVRAARASSAVRS